MDPVKVQALLAEYETYINSIDLSKEEKIKILALVTECKSSPSKENLLDLASVMETAADSNEYLAEVYERNAKILEDAASLAQTSLDEQVETAKTLADAITNSEPTTSAVGDNPPPAPVITQAAEQAPISPVMPVADTPAAQPYQTGTPSVPTSVPTPAPVSAPVPENNGL